MRIALTSLAGLIVAVAPAAGAPLHLNLAETLGPLGQKLREGQQVDMVFIGDSLTARQGTYFDGLSRNLRMTYGDAGAGYQAFSVFTGASIPGWWGSGPINQDPWPHWGLDGLYSESIHGGIGTLAMKDTAMELHYLSRPNGGQFRPRISSDGVETVGPWVSANYSDWEVSTWRHDSTAGFTSIGFEADPNQRLLFLGANHINPNVPGIRTHRVANGGYGVENYLIRQPSFDQQMKALDAELIVIWLGQNDQNYNQVGYASSMVMLIDRLRLSSPEAQILLIGTYNQGAPVLPELVEGVADAAAMRNVGFLNLYELGGTPQWLASQGYLDDGIHFSPAGGEYFANLIGGYFDAHLGTIPAVPEPSTAGTLLITRLLSRRRR